MSNAAKSLTGKAARAQRMREVAPKKPLRVSDWFTEGEGTLVARREEVAGLLMWFEQMRRKNVWWRRLRRWVWLRIPFLPKPPKGDPRRTVNRDPLVTMAVFQAMAHKEREAGNANP